jgi:hypothetical protein
MPKKTLIDLRAPSFRLAALACNLLLTVSCTGDPSEILADSGQPDPPTPDGTPPDAGGTDDSDARTPGCDPGAWREELLPPDEISNTEVGGLHGTAPDDLWAVTNNAQIHHRGPDGWRSSTVSSGALRGVWAIDRNNAWVVGQMGYIGHWNGDEWITERATDEPNNDVMELFDVHALSADDVWAVGLRIPTGNPPSGRPVVMRRRQGAWERVSAPAGAPNGLLAVWATRPNDVWAAGHDGVFYFDGTTWTRQLNVSTVDVMAIGNEVWALRAVATDAKALCHTSGVGAPWACETLPADLIGGAKMVARDDTPVVSAHLLELGSVFVIERQGDAWRAQEVHGGQRAPLWLGGDDVWVGGTERVHHRGCR